LSRRVERVFGFSFSKNVIEKEKSFALRSSPQSCHPDFFAKNGIQCIFSGHLVRRVLCHCESKSPKQSSFCRFIKVGNKLSINVRNVRFR
jgi:hypothetical protein